MKRRSAEKNRKRRPAENIPLHSDEPPVDSINNEQDEAAVKAYSSENETVPRARSIAEPPVVVTSG